MSTLTMIKISLTMTSWKVDDLDKDQFDLDAGRVMKTMTLIKISQTLMSWQSNEDHDLDEDQSNLNFGLEW